jgi:hypothetical protein
MGCIFNFVWLIILVKNPVCQEIVFVKKIEIELWEADSSQNLIF